MVFEIQVCGIYSAPYGLISKCFGSYLPSLILDFCTKFGDDRSKDVGVMVNQLKAPPNAKIHWSVAVMFLDQSGSFIIEMCLVIPQSCVPNLVLIEYNL